jgi:hypothetical protein
MVQRHIIGSVAALLLMASAACAETILVLAPQSDVADPEAFCMALKQMTHRWPTHYGVPWQKIWQSREACYKVAGGKEYWFFAYDERQFTRCIASRKDTDRMTQAQIEARRTEVNTRAAAVASQIGIAKLLVLRCADWQAGLTAAGMVKGTP